MTIVYGIIEPLYLAKRLNKASADFSYLVGCVKRMAVKDAVRGSCRKASAGILEVSNKKKEETKNEKETT